MQKIVAYVRDEQGIDDEEELNFKLKH